MSAGTKVTVAIVVLFAAVLGVYYGFGGPGSAGLTPAEVLPPAEQDPDSPAVEPAVVQDPTGAVAVGLLGQSIEETLWPQGGPTVANDVQVEDPWVLRAPTLMPEPEARPVQAAGGARTVEYVVQEDDSLWTIAAQWFGDATRWQEIAEANPAINPDRLRVGQKLQLPSHQPDAGAVALNRAVAVPAAPTTGKARPAAGDAYYTVRRGDTLSTIAQARYHNGSRWREIYDANRTAIGWDPDRLKVGMRLRMPAK